MDQIRTRRDALEQQRQQDKLDSAKYTGLKIGEYNPNFRDLLKSELDKQIREKKEKTEAEKNSKAREEKDRLRKMNDMAQRSESEAQAYQISMKKKLKDMVKGDYDRAWKVKENARRPHLIDKDVVPEIDLRDPPLFIDVDGKVDTVHHSREPHKPHDVNRFTEAEQDYWFVKRLLENEQNIVQAEERDKKKMNIAMENMMHEDEDPTLKKVIVGSKIKTKHIK
jgi:hypothetical protein